MTLKSGRRGVSFFHSDLLTLFDDQIRQDNISGEKRISIVDQPRPSEKGAGIQRSRILLADVLETRYHYQQ